jgi:hypothetical protein
LYIIYVEKDRVNSALATPEGGGMKSRYALMVLSLVLVLAMALPTVAATRLVLVEAFTQWNCPPCAAWNPTEHSVLTSLGRTVAVAIKYHVWWPGSDNDPIYHYNTAESAARVNYYAVTGVPDGFIDGLTEVNRSASGFRSQLTNRHNVAAPCTIEMTASMVSPSSPTVNYTGTITATDSALNNVQLYVVLVSDSLHLLGGSNGETDFPNGFRDVAPGWTGQNITLALGGSTEFSGTLNKELSWTPENMTVIAFLQDASTKWVHQAGVSDVYLPYGVATSTTDPRQAFGSPGLEQTYTITMSNRGSNDDVYSVNLNGNLPTGWTRSIEASIVPANPDSISVPLFSGEQTTLTVRFNPHGNRGAVNFTVDVASPHDVNARATESFSYLANPEVLVINDNNSTTDMQNYFTAAMNDVVGNARTWGIWNWQLQTLDLTALGTANIVVWFTGNSPNNGTLSFTEQDLLQQFLQGGGKLFLTGQGIAFDLRTSSFLSEVLHTSYNAIQLHGRNIAGCNGESFAITGGDGANNQSRPCAISPFDAMADVCWSFSDTTGRYSGTRVTTPDYRAVFLSFGLEAINSAALRDTVLHHALNYLDGIEAVGDKPTAVPQEFALLQNYPNPFNPETTIPFALAQRSQVTLKVFDLLGRNVATLVNGAMNAGQHSVSWNASQLASGLYFYRLEATAGDKTYQSTRKLMLMK